MKMAMKIKKIIFSCTFILVVMFLSASFINLYAQDKFPREYTNPDEIVAFDKETSYIEAMEVINQFLQEYRNKFIIDQSEASGTIGVTLPAMHWEEALTFILRVKSLGLKEFDDYVEILPLSELQATSTTDQPEEVNPNSINPINLKTREVRINATFFEGNKRALQEIGIDWSTLTNNVPENINQIVTGEAIDQNLSAPQATEFGDQFVSVNSFNASSVSQNVFNALVNLGEIGPGIRVQALFSAFEADNLGEVLATPSVKVVDGQEGRIQVGQDFSIKQRDIAGNVTDQFFSTGTILTVTPTVISTSDTSFIHLQIAVERSSALPDAVSTIINKQEAKTEALLLDGESTSIAGLYRTEENKVRRGVPILKDLPPWFFGLKYLFGYNSNDYVENELIIIVQAELEQTLEERLTQRTFNSQRSVLNQTQTTHRNALDKVFENPYVTFPTVEVNEVVDNTNSEVDSSIVDDYVESIADLAKDESELNTNVEESKLAQPKETPVEELTEEQIKLAKELSMPIENPELMMVVPKAFSLDEFLIKKESGEDIDVEEKEDEENLRIFVVAGSFIVQSYATRFHAGLVNEGYDSRILYHPTSRFNYVAYQAFSDFDEAVTYLRKIQSSINSESWLFSTISR